MRTKVFVAVAGALLMLTPMSAQAQVGPWEKLGQRQVDYRAERDTIMVTAAEGRFNAIKLGVRGSGIRLIDLKVHFGNGEVQDVAVRNFIEAGGETRVIDLNGGPRIIKKVTFIYKTPPRRTKPGKGVVHLHGRHPGPATPPAPPSTPADDDRGWEKLGEKVVGFGVDRDTIVVTRAEGVFTKVRFRVKENDIHFLDMKIHYANGDVQDVQIRKRIPQGGITRVIDLPGNKRIIKKVVFWYRTEGFVGRRAHVAFWGRQG
jgi:hypothetical protein